MLFFILESVFPQVLSVVISEVMYKPDPVVGLPDVEYVELFNRSDGAVCMEGWNLKVGRTLKAIPSVELPARSCLLLAAKADTALLSGYGRVVALPSLSLNNTSQSLSLTNSVGQVLFTFTYRHEWQEASKRTGGWSLEMSDTAFPCVESGNWRSSADLSGGTPGRIPERRPLSPEASFPVLKRAANIDSQDVQLFFSGKLHPEHVWNPAAYRVDGVEPVERVLELSPDWTSVRVRLRHPILYGEIHDMRAAAPLCDCGFRPLEPASARFGRSELADSLDMVINEVMFHPKDGGVPFVEIYNRSEKILDLKELRLSTYRSDGVLDTGKRVTDGGWQLFPGGYICMSKDAKTVCSQYPCVAENMLEMSAFPTYAQSGGRVVLLERGIVLDDFAYSEKMHYPLLADVAGVSLERVNPDLETQNEAHWCSAASLAGYGTPGAANSCYSSWKPEPGEEIQLESTIFSPDGDGYADRLTIRYSFHEPSLRGSVWIFSMDGVPVRRLLNNGLLASEGTLVWDGVTDNGMYAPSGAYMLLFEYWSLDGKVKRFRKAVTIAHRW